MVASDGPIEETVERLLAEGLSFIDQGRLDDAIGKFTEVLLHDRNSERAVAYLDRCWAAKRGEVPLPRDGGPPMEQGGAPGGDVSGASGPLDPAGMVMSDDGLSTGPLDATDAPPLPEDAILGPASDGPADTADSGLGDLPMLDAESILEVAIDSGEIDLLGLDPVADYALRQVDGTLKIGELADICLLDRGSALHLYTDLLFRGVVRVQK